MFVASDDRHRGEQVRQARRARQGGITKCPLHIPSYIWDMTKPRRAKKAAGLRNLTESRLVAWLRESGDDGQGDDAGDGDGAAGGDNQVSQCAELAKRVGHVRDCLRLGHPLNSADASTLAEVQDFLTQLAGGAEGDDAAEPDETMESLRDPNYVSSKKGRVRAGRQLRESRRATNAATAGVPADPQSLVDWLRSE